jgi:hypothetical protein
MIYAVNMTCSRDAELEELMAKTLEKYCPECGVLLSLNTDDTPYANGAGWEASMMKLEAIRQLLSENEITDKDFVLSVDSDVVFCSPQVFKYVDHQYGIVGIKHSLLYPTFFGEWSHMSGALIFIRGDIAKKICALPEQELNNVRFNHFKPFDMTENEDVVLSYLASYVGAQQFALPGHLSSGDFEGDVIGTYRIGSLSKGQLMGDMITHRIKSFYHLNYCPTQFMGEPVTGKWDIAKVLKIKNIEL